MTRRIPIGVQPYTVREALAEDYVGTLEKLAAIGYKGIELGRPPEGMSVGEQRTILERLGMQVIGTHAGFNTFDFDPDAIADYLEETGGERHVAISLMFDSLADVRDKAAKLDEIGERFHRRGVKFLYHNHDWEFERYEGVCVIDHLMRLTDPDFVQLELDTYWIRRGGEDPAAYLAKYAGRCPLLHIKDVGFGPDQPFAEIGEGTLDFKEIAAAAEAAGTLWLVVEQDVCRRDPFESLSISYRNLTGLGLV
ncbi:MAG: sugar phosphate isomerase/epimerase [Cohnella sp.]|nr:sugar phosphate isomerase/epimerase [Cohnella sp.]